MAVAALWKAKAGDANVEEYLDDHNRSGGGGGGGADGYVAKMLPYEDSNWEEGGLEHFPPSEDAPIRGTRK